MDRRLDRVVKVNPSAMSLAMNLCMGGTAAEDAIREIYAYPPHIAAMVMQILPDIAKAEKKYPETIINRLVNGLTEEFMRERDNPEPRTDDEINQGHADLGITN